MKTMQIGDIRAALNAKHDNKPAVFQFDVEYLKIKSVTTATHRDKVSDVLLAEHEIERYIQEMSQDSGEKFDADSRIERLAEPIYRIELVLIDENNS